MNFKQILDLAYNIIDEVDEDEQIEIIVKNAVNEAYRELSKIDKRISTAYVPVIMGTATLPDGCLQIIQCTPQLDSNDKLIGNAIITSKTGILEMVYAVAPDDLEQDEDEPELNVYLHEALSLYAGYKYMLHRKKETMAQQFLNRYMMKINNYEETQASMLGCINDAVVIEY